MEHWMGNASLYEEDILLWSEQQAAIIRQLGQARRHIPNDLDIENVAEEIESVGRSELAAVDSFIQLIFVHLIKLLAEPDAETSRHWRSEIIAFHLNMLRRYSPSMRQRLDLDELWRGALEQVMPLYEGALHQAVADLPARCVLSLDELLVQRIDSFGLVDRLRRASPLEG
jgi:hypothetical protein